MPYRAIEALQRTATRPDRPKHVVEEVHARLIARTLPDEIADQVEQRALCKTFVEDPLLPSAKFPKVVQVEARVLHTFTPLFISFDPLTADRAGVAVFIAQEFPAIISFNSISATRFQTDVTITDSGDGDRNARWEVPLMEYDVAYGVRTMEDLHAIIGFFRLMRGRKHSFLFHDVIDHTSTLAFAKESRRAPDIKATDQYQMTGDNNRYKFQLRKGYGPEPYTSWRPIYKPKPPGTIIPHAHQGPPPVAPGPIVAKNGVAVTNFTVNYETGEVTFVSDLQTIALNCNVVEAYQSGGQWITKIETTTPFPADWLFHDRVIISGFASGPNNTTITDVTKIEGFENNRTRITLSGPPNYGQVENGLRTVTFKRHPCPREGVVVTAGFHFWVCTRFDTDRLPTSLEEYGVGAATDVKLMEVRPGDE